MPGTRLRVGMCSYFSEVHTWGHVAGPRASSVFGSSRGCQAVSSHAALYFPSSGAAPRVPTWALASLATACPLTAVRPVRAHAWLCLPVHWHSTRHKRLSSPGQPSPLTPLPTLRPQCASCHPPVASPPRQQTFPGFCTTTVSVRRTHLASWAL